MELKFNSRVCTTIEQSKKLLELGLKPETADMYYAIDTGIYEVPYSRDELLGALQLNTCTPRWSLHRLLELNSVSIMVGTIALLKYDNTYDDIIEDIEWTVKKGYFNKEYLNK